MDSENISTLNNSSSLLQKEVNIGLHLQTYYDTRTMLFSSTVNLLMCILGTPGNVLVMTVYVRKMTSSVRVYMFALSVVDLTTCISGIVLSVAPVDNMAMVFVFFAGDISIIFSTFLLAFIAIERILAVRRPYAFKCSAQRAKKTLVVIALASVACAAVLELARLLGYQLLARVFPMVITVPAINVMIGCYVLMGITLIKKKRAARSTIGVLFGLQSHVPRAGSIGVNTVSISTVFAPEPGDVPKATTTANQTNTYKSVSLLFTITAVYIVCWMPLWLHYAGLSVPVEIRGVFLLNAVVNPFIYSVVSAMFRSDVKIVFRQICSRLTAWHQ